MLTAVLSMVLGGLCPGDTGLDGVVDVVDLIVVVSTWGLTCPPDPVPCPPDVTGDGTVNVLDLVEVVTNWGACP